MPLKNRLTDLAFKRDEAGRTIVYLYGSKGYFVPDGATEARLRTAKLWLIITAFVAALIGMPIIILLYGQIYDWPFAAWCITIAGLMVAEVGQRALVRWVTRGLEAAPPIAIAESWQRLLDAAPRLWRWYMWYLIVSAPFVLLGSVLYLVGGTWVPGYFFALSGVAFSGCMVAGGIYGLRCRPRS
jgi:hypothetical protein